MKIRSMVLAVLMLIIAAAVIAYGFTYTVAENQVALKLSADNQVVSTDDVPGLHFTFPVAERIRKLDKRIVSHDYAEDRYVTRDGQTLRVDCFIVWQIADAAAYYQATQGSDDTLVQALGASAKNALKDMITKRNLKQAVAAERNEFVTELFNVVATSAAPFGVKLIDIRIHKIGLPENYNEPVYTNMRNGLHMNAVTTKAQGETGAREIRAQADLDRIETLSNANSDAAKIRGDGDARAAAIYAGASRANAEFFSFYRSLQAYRDSIGKPGDVLIVSPDSDFFKYFNKPAVR